MAKRLGLVISITLAVFLGFALVGCSDSDIKTETASASEVTE